MRNKTNIPLPPQEKQTFLNSFDSLKHLPRFFGLIWKTNPRLTLLNILFRLLQSVIPVLLLYFGKLIIDEVIRLTTLPEKDFDRLYLLVGIELALALLSDLFSRVIDLTDGLLTELYTNKVSVEIIQKAAHLELRQLEDPDFYDKLDRARRQTTTRGNLMATVLTQGQDLITVLSLAAGLILIEPWLILLLVLAIIPSFINEIKFSTTSYSLARRWTPERRELDYLAYIGGTDETAKEVKLFGLSDYLSDRFSRLAHRYYLANRRLAIRRATWGGVFNVLGVAAYYVAYAIILLRAAFGIITIGDLTFLAGSFNRLQARMQMMFSRFTKIAETAMYLQDYFEFLDMEVAPAVQFEPRKVPERIVDGIVFDNVGFRYPTGEEFVFRNVSFRLKAGEKLALVGKNGSGKTTLVKLLLRLYEPTEGRILLDGVDIRHFDPEEYRDLFGAIFQDFVRYNFTAAENIGVGDVEQLDNRDRIRYAAEKSMADEVIEALPDQYDQQLGKRFLGGVDLSGGQWQKLALARAYMTDAEVIILDEPTAALDAEAEYEAFLRFVELTADKTSVIISHRFSTVRMADRIAVLGEGRLLELGTHKELMMNGGLYAELFELQAKGYQ